MKIHAPHRPTQFCLMIALLTVFLSGCKGGGSSSILPENNDKTPPTIVSTLPVNGDKEVPPNVLLNATFSEQIEPATLSLNSFIMNAVQVGGGTAVSGTLTYSSDTMTATFQPAALLNPNTSYNIIITTGVEDLAGNNMAAPFSNWAFTTGADIDNSPPSFPNGSQLVANATSSTSIALSWSAAQDATPENRMRYLVCRSTTPGVCKQDPFPAGAVLTETPPGATSLEVTGLVKSTPYYFVVRAKDLVNLIDQNAFEATATTPGTFVSLGSSLNVAFNQDARNPSIAMVGSTPYVSWDERTVSSRKINVKKYNNSSWSLVADVNPNGPAQQPRVISDRSATPIPYITYTDTSALNYQIIVKKLSGASWTQVPPNASLNIDSAHSASNSAIAFDTNNIPYVIWGEQNSQGIFQIYVAHLSGGSWVQDPLDGSSLNHNTAMTASSPSIAINGTTVIAAWSECPPNTSGGCLTYSRALNGSLVGATWSSPADLHRAGPFSSSDNVPSLAFVNDVIFISWQEFGKIYIQSATGSGFTSPLDVGAASASANTTVGTTATVMGTQVPYLVFSDSSLLLVKRWNGTSWISEGGALNISSGQPAGESSIAFDRGTPYIAWSEEDGFGTAQVYVKRLE